MRAKRSLRLCSPTGAFFLVPNQSTSPKMTDSKFTLITSALLMVLKNTSKQSLFLLRNLKTLNSQFKFKFNLITITFFTLRTLSSLKNTLWKKRYPSRRNQRKTPLLMPPHLLQLQMALEKFLLKELHLLIPKWKKNNLKSLKKSKIDTRT